MFLQGALGLADEIRYGFGLLRLPVLGPYGSCRAQQLLSKDLRHGGAREPGIEFNNTQGECPCT